jgi:hypothetical protein
MGCSGRGRASPRSQQTDVDVRRPAIVLPLAEPEGAVQIARASPPPEYSSCASTVTPVARPPFPPLGRRLKPPSTTHAGREVCPNSPSA